jgi:iron complex transport system substrate-binding protein
MSFTGTPSVPAPRRSVPLALFAVVVLIVAGAAVAATSAYFVLKPSSTPSGSLTLTDDLGRTVAVPRDPARVVVLAPSITDSMALLGLRSHIVAVDCGLPVDGGIYNDYNTSQVTAWNLSQSMCIETYPNLDIPAILNATPDLVLAATITSVSDVEQMSQTYGIPVVLLQPSTLGGIEVDLSLLGEIFGVTSASEALEGQIQGVLATAQSIVANLSALPTVLLTYSATPSSYPSPGYYSFGPGTFGESLLEFVGASSISANATFPYPELSGSQVLYADPQIVLYGTGFGQNLSNTYAVAPDWSSLSAVMTGNDYAVDSNFVTEPDPTMVLQGVPILLDLLHPGTYP